jgi:hypothetical protein
MATKKTNYRRSDTGKYTTKDYAAKHPKTTEKERGPHPPKKGK